MCFSLKCCDFLNSASSAAALVFDLTFCTTRGNRERPESRIYFKILEITQYLINTLYLTRKEISSLSCKYHSPPESIRVGGILALGPPVVNVTPLGTVKRPRNNREVSSECSNDREFWKCVFSSLLGK